MVDTPTSAGLWEPGFGSRPGSPIMSPSWPRSSWVGALDAHFVALRVAADDMYPNLSAQGDVTNGKGNHVSSTLVPWNRRVSGFSARTLALTSSGSRSVGTRAGLMRFRAGRSLSTDTVGRTFSS